jgi:hypothetical protein
MLEAMNCLEVPVRETGKVSIGPRAFHLSVGQFTLTPHSPKQAQPASGGKTLVRRTVNSRRTSSLSIINTQARLPQAIEDFCQAPSQTFLSKFLFEQHAGEILGVGESPWSSPG